MPNSTDGSEHERTASGPDWIGLDGRALRVRRDAEGRREREAAQREAEQQADDAMRVSEFRKRALADSVDDLPSGAEKAALAASGEDASRQREPRPRPSALINSLYIENLKSLAGRHEVSLAPLTLIYGPNSAGKSTVIHGLKLFMKAVDVGRRDALQVWRMPFEDSAPLRSLTTWDAPDPEDPTGTHWRSKLSLGVDFRNGDGDLARAELAFEPNVIGPIDYVTSGLGMLDEDDLTRKMIGPEEPDPFDPDYDPATTFGDSALLRYAVGEKHPGGEWTGEVRVFDPELFAHPSGALKADLFALAYLMRYLGPHRGAPTGAYRPLQGPFNRSVSPYELVNYDRWGIGGFGGYEVLNQMMSQLDIPYEFEKNLKGAKQAQNGSWDLKDVRSGALVGLDEVGYGVGQLLPVIDVCVHARQQVICIEEPELHLHPRLQAKLGNLFATSVLHFRNQVILETHSESILLRIRRLIRRGKLRPDEVALLYVDNNGEHGATVRRLRLGAHGELLDPWPSGFFDESLADILDITS